MEVIFTGHVYNLQSDLNHRGLISQRSMTEGGFQRLSSLSNFLCPNEMAETCLEAFWWGLFWESIKNMTFINLNERWLGCLYGDSCHERHFPTPSRVCSGWLPWDKVRLKPKVWRGLGPSYWIQKSLFCYLNALSMLFAFRYSIQWQFSTTKKVFVKWLLCFSIKKRDIKITKIVCGRIVAHIWTRYNKRWS
jgi:hypothetical protein